MTASWRFSTLADRHRALGSKLEDWSGMGTAWTYDKDADEEYVAIRTKAGLMDVSGLKRSTSPGRMPRTSSTSPPRAMRRRSIPASPPMPVC